MRPLRVALCALLFVACGGDPPAPSGDAGAADARGVDAAPPDAAPLDAGGPVLLGPPGRTTPLLSPDPQPSEPAPLVLLLHGYGPGEVSFAFLLDLAARLRARGFFALVPMGSEDSSGYHFWNANPACCDLDGSGVDDVAFLRGLILEAGGRAPIDPDRIFVFGHSNGGFMAYRMACEASDRIAAIASLAGTDHPMEGGCVPARPVSVLHIHGDADMLVPYEGGTAATGATIPGAEETVRRWATYAGCDPAGLLTGPERDHELDIPGAETLPATFGAGCTGAGVTLWRMRGAPHVPTFTDRFFLDVGSWLEAHPRAT